MSDSVSICCWYRNILGNSSLSLPNGIRLPTRKLRNVRWNHAKCDDWMLSQWKYAQRDSTSRGGKEKHETYKLRGRTVKSIKKTPEIFSHACERTYEEWNESQTKVHWCTGNFTTHETFQWHFSFEILFFCAVEHVQFSCSSPRSRFQFNSFFMTFMPLKCILWVCSLWHAATNSLSFFLFQNWGPWINKWCLGTEINFRWTISHWSECNSDKSIRSLDKWTNFWRF
jgi:hypothetical protein